MSQSTLPIVPLFQLITKPNCEINEMYVNYYSAFDSSGSPDFTCSHVQTNPLMCLCTMIQHWPQALIPAWVTFIQPIYITQSLRN